MSRVGSLYQRCVDRMSNATLLHSGNIGNAPFLLQDGRWATLKQTGVYDLAGVTQYYGFEHNAYYYVYGYIPYSIHKNYIYVTLAWSSSPNNYARLIKVNTDTWTATTIQEWNDGSSLLDYVIIGPVLCNSSLGALLRSSSVTDIWYCYSLDLEAGTINLIATNSGTGYTIGNFQDLARISNGYLYYTEFYRTSPFNTRYRKTSLSSWSPSTIDTYGSQVRFCGIQGFFITASATNYIYNEAKSTTWDMGKLVEGIREIGPDGTDMVILAVLSDGVYVVRLIAGGTHEKTLIYSVTNSTYACRGDYNGSVRSNLVPNGIYASSGEDPDVVAMQAYDQAAVSTRTLIFKNPGRKDLC